MTLTHSGASELNQLMEGTTAGALIPEIVRRGLQELLEAEVSALTGAQLHERCPDQRSTHRNANQSGGIVVSFPQTGGGTCCAGTATAESMGAQQAGPLIKMLLLGELAVALSAP